MAQYAMYAYCFFAILSLVNTVCGSLGVAVNIPSILLTIKQWVLMLAAIALWGIFRLIQPRNEKLLRRCCEVMVFYYSLHLCQYVLCFFQHTRLYIRIL